MSNESVNPIKMGLDDYLVSHSTEEFKSLKLMTIDELKDNSKFDVGEWEEIVPFVENFLPPFSENLLPGPLGSFVNALADFTETPRELTALFSLSVISAAVGGKFEIEIKSGYKEPVHIWVCAALESGNRKTSVCNECTKPITSWESKQFMEFESIIKDAESKRLSEETVIKGLRSQLTKANPMERAQLMEEIRSRENELIEIPKSPRILCQDITPERLGELMSENAGAISLISDEGGIFDTMAGRYSNGVINFDVFLQGHAGSPIRVDRRSRPPIHLDKPALTISLSPQPDVLTGLAKNPSFRGRGLLARFLYVIPVSLLGSRKGNTKPIPEKIRLDYDNMIQQLLVIECPVNESGNKYPQILRLSIEAHSNWYYFWQEVEADLSEGRILASIRDWASKLPGAVARIAGLLHVSEHAFSQSWSNEISSETMLRAISIGKILIKHALAVFLLMEADPNMENAKKVLRWIKQYQHLKFKERDCHYALKGSIKKIADLRLCLKILQDHYFIRIGKQEQVSHRPSVWFEVNPSYLSSGL